MNEVDKHAMILWEYNLMHHELTASDAILALGSMDDRVAERAAELWHEGLAPVVVVSGGYGRLTGQNRGMTEAERFKHILLSKDVASKAILVEDASTNTGANLQLSIKKLEDFGIRAKKVIIVTKPYMEKRTYATMKKLFPSVTPLNASPMLSYSEYPHGEITKDLMINIMVGDTKRIEDYPSRGYAVEMEMPLEVKTAMNFLIKAGFNEQLPALVRNTSQ